MPDQLSSYIAINADGTVVRLLRQDGHGPGPATSRSARWWPKSSTCRSRPSRCSWATPRTSVNQGGASGSTGIQLGGKQMRAAAAEARRVLVEMAAAEARRCRPISSPSPTASCTPRATAAKKATYAELIGGRYFNVQLEWNKQIGNALYAPGKAQAEEPEGLQDRRQADQARRHRAEGVRAGGRSSPTSRCRAWCMPA